jgi:hypothetical protein
LLAGVVLFACSRQATDEERTAPDVTGSADTIYTNGKIYTVNEAQEWAEAVQQATSLRFEPDL